MTIAEAVACSLADTIQTRKEPRRAYEDDCSRRYAASIEELLESTATPILVKTALRPSNRVKKSSLAATLAKRENSLSTAARSGELPNL